MSASLIIGITFGITAGILYIICCIYSLRKAIRDRKTMIERNFRKRNKRYLKDLGINTNDIHNLYNYDFPADYSSTVKFAANNVNNEPQLNDEKCQNNNTVTAKIVNNGKQHLENRGIRRINLEDIDEVLNEKTVTTSEYSSPSISEATKFSGCTFLSGTETSKANNEDNTAIEIVANTSSELPKMEKTPLPKVTYLKAKKKSNITNNKSSDLQNTNKNWISTRLEDAKRQLEFGNKRAPLAKQNSGFSSMDEESSSSYI